MQFTESQKFRQWWIWLIIIGVSVSTILSAVYAYNKVGGELAGNTLFSFIFSFIPLLVILLFWLLRLDTMIDETGITYCYYPFIKTKHIPWSELQQAYVRKYSPLMEYGGWGIRVGMGRKSGAYNVSGNMGLQLVFKNGRYLLLGTQRADELETYMQDLYKKGLVNKGETELNIKDRY